MRAILFNEIMGKSETERGREIEPEPNAPLSVEKIQKIAAHTGTDLGVAACIVMKHDPNSYQAYRQQSFRPVNS